MTPRAIVSEALGTALLVLAAGVSVIFFAGLSWRLVIPPVVLGLVAAVPTSLTGTPVGMALLAWAGVDRWRR